MVDCKGKCHQQFPPEALSDSGFCISCHDKEIDLMYSRGNTKGIGGVRINEKKSPEEVRANYLKRKKRYNDTHRNQISQYNKNRRAKNRGSNSYDEPKPKPKPKPIRTATATINPH